MTYDKYFPKDFLNAEDLLKAPKVLTIRQLHQEEIGPDKEKKLVARFHEIAEATVVNKTNATTLELLFGPEEQDAIDGQVELFAGQAMFSGKLVPAIRLRRPSRSNEVPTNREPLRRSSPTITATPPDIDAPPHDAVPDGPDGNDLLY